jgi:parvulin-like peptidyl-prolyl isomerase
MVGWPSSVRAQDGDPDRPAAVWSGDRAAIRINSEILTTGQFGAVALRAGVGSTSSSRQRAMVLGAMLDFVLLRQDSAKVDIADAEQAIRGRARDAYQTTRRQYDSDREFRAALASLGLDPDAFRQQLEDTEEDNERIARHVARRIDPARLVRKPGGGPADAYRLSRLGLRVKRGETTAPARLSHILADSVLERRPFAEVVRRHSEVPGSKQDSGDLGWLPARDLDPDLLRAVRDLPVGRVSAPVRTGDYWCVFLVNDRRDKDPRGADAAFRDARETLLRQLRRAATVELLDPSLRDLVAHLPPGYRLQVRSGARPNTRP